MKRFGLVAITAMLFLFGAQQITAQQIAVNVSLNGQPASGVSVVFLAANLIKTPSAQPKEADKNALNLANLLKTRTATTDSSGTSILDLSNIIKPHGQTEVQIVVRICKDGKNVVYILQKGERVPPQDEKCVNNEDCKCKDRPVAGIFPVGDGDIINIGINPETIDVHVTQGGGAVTGLPSGPSLVSVQVGGGVGLKQFASINSCRAFLAVSSGATCQSGDKAFAGGVDGALIFGRYLGLLGAVYRTTSISRKGGASTSAGTSSEMSKVGSTIELAGVEVFLPSLGRVTLSFDAAAAFQQIRLEETQSLTSTSGTFVATTDHSVDTVGPAGGAKIQISITKHWGAQVGYQYIQGKNTPAVDEHNHVVLFGIYFRFP